MLTGFFKIFILFAIATIHMSRNSQVESRDPFALMSDVRISSFGPYKGMIWKRAANPARYTLDGSLPLIFPVFGPPLGIPNSFWFTIRILTKLMVYHWNPNEIYGVLES